MAASSVRVEDDLGGNSGMNEYDTREPALSDDDLNDIMYSMAGAEGFDEQDVEASFEYDDSEALNSISDIDIDVKTNNVLIQDVFSGGIVKWVGSKDARYVVLVDTPKREDLRSGTLDSSGKIRRTFSEIIESLPKENQGGLAVVSCLVGWDSNQYRKEGTPYATELDVSVPFLEALLLQLPNLKVIITLGQYATELCFRRFDVYDMYSKSRKHGTLTPVDAPSPSMFLRRTYDKFFTTVIGNERPVRYMCSPPMYHAHFRAFVRGCLYQVNKLELDTIAMQDFDVRGPELQFTEEDTRDCINYKEFKERIYERIRTEHAQDIRSVFNDASRDPSREEGNERTLLVYDVEYDSVKNVMYMHTGTPSGTPMRVTVSNLTFTFWIRPHPAFALGQPGNWCDRDDERALAPEHLKPLQAHLDWKLKYRAKERIPFSVLPKNASEGVPIVSLSVDSTKDDNSDGQWQREGEDGKVEKERLTDFIRCDVNNYAYIAHIRTALTALYKDYTEKHPQKGKNEDIRKFYDDRLDFYEILPAEKMFINRYNVRMSHWYRVSNLDVDKPKPVSFKHGVEHVTYLSASLCLPKHFNPMECLPPEKSMELNYNGMTSSDMPADVRGSFDIEVSKFGKNFGTFLNSPIICICVAVRRHDNKTTQLEKDTYLPKDGYEYFGFMLGNVQRDRDDSELCGRENLFMFTSEREMLNAYYKFYDLLKPRYYASHNGKSYDHNYCMNRLSLIGGKKRVIGYVPDQTVRLTQKQFDSKAFGEKTVTSYDGEKGITQLDTLEIFMREKKYESYRLGFIARETIGMTKNDMPYNAIMGYWRESAWSRRVLLDYCYRDAQLPDQILSHGQWVVNVNEMARANGSVAESVMHEKGVQEKILGAYAMANDTIGRRYLVRTNDWKTKKQNETIVERWVEEELYAEEAEHETFSKKRGAEDGSRVVATFNPLKRKDEEEAAWEDRSSLPRNKRQPPKKVQRLPSSKETINHFFRKLSKEEIAQPDDAHTTSVHIPGLNLSEKEKQLKALSDLAKAKIAGKEMNRKADYQGAVVMDAMLGWHYKLPLGCMDFASLYPSIIMAYNMGSNTKVYGDELEKRGYTLDDVYEPAKDLRVINPRTKAKVHLYFLKEHICKGIISLMEERLVGLRNVAKVLIEPYGNEFLDDNVTPNPRYNPTMSAIMKQRSDGLKIMANSGYGSLGSTGLLCDKDVAAAVTACGREAITLVRDKTSKKTGAICRGGDTDSVFMEFCGLAKGTYKRKWKRACARVAQWEAEGYDGPMEAKFPAVPDGWYRCNTVADVEKLADELLMPYLNKFFKRPMKLDYEKAMCRFVALAKKRYIYFMCIRGKKPYLNYKGLEVIRRDSLPITKRTMKEVFNILQFLRDPNDTDEEDQAKINERKKRARAYIRQQAERLANGDVTIDELILSKQRSREYYANENQEHLTVVRKMEERGLDASPVGSRVYYVYTHMCSGVGGAARKGYEIADDPEFVVQNNIPPDYLYYYERKFKGPVIRVLRYFFWDDMVERILKRKREQVRLESSRKRAKTESARNFEVTLDEVTQETEDYLFGKPTKAKNLQARYTSLRGTKVASAHVDKSNQSSIAFYARNERTRREHLKLQYELDDDTAVLDKEIERFERTQDVYEQCLKECRTCLKIKDVEEVQCSAYDCKKFYPRITALGRHTQARNDLETLVREFTDLRVAIAETAGDGEQLGRSVDQSETGGA